MRKLGLVYSVLVLCYGYCSSSLAQMQDEGTTVTLETIGEEVTSTTTVITNETTGNILGPDGTGIVAPRYEGDMQQDWGGKNSASMPSSCEFNTGTCAKGTSSATTFEQTIQISDFYAIKDGGALAWELDFLHYYSSSTGYIQSKGYDSNNILQWDTTQVALPHSSTPVTHSGAYDFSGDFSKLNIIIGGGYYKFDNVSFIINYNTITITTDTWLEIIEPLQQITQNIIIEDSSLEDNITGGIPIFDIQPVDMGMPIDVFPGTTSAIDVQPIEIDIPVEYQEVMVEVDTLVQDFKDMGSTEQPEIAIIPNEPSEIDISMPEPEIKAPETGAEAPQEEAEVVEVPTKTEDSDPESQPKEVEVVEKEPETKEVVEAKEEPKEKETAAKEEPKEKTLAEKKQEKAEKIINSFESPYQNIAGLVTLRIMDALSADLSVYQNQTIQDVTWYTQQEFYQDNYIPDPYGNYISVRSSLDMEEMIGSQYK